MCQQMIVDEATTLLEVDGAGGTPRLVGLAKDGPRAVVMDYVPGRLLRDYLKSCPTKTHRNRVLDEVMKAVRSIRDKGFVHRDLNSNHIIVDTSNNSKIQIIDVGLARKVTDTDVPWLDEYVEQALKFHTALDRRFL